MLLVTLLLGGCGSGPGTPAAGTRAAPPMGGPGAPGGMPVQVIAEEVTPQSFTDRFTALGTARANESIDITSRTTSVVTRINFREGQVVQPNQQLVELDTRQQRADLNLAQAQLSQAESQFRRSNALAETMVVSAADLDQLRANLEVARAQVSGAETRLDILSIRAPFAGTVGLRRVSLGDLVGPETVITTLDDTRIIKLEFAVPEIFLADLSTGMSVQAESPVYPGRPFTGSVVSIDTRVDPTSRSITILATIPNPDGMLKPGMFLTVALEKRRENVLLVPEEALVPRQGRQYVFVVQDGKAVEQEVTLGGRAPGLAEIREGLDAGALVVTEGTQRIRNGTPVQLAPAG
ncbi:MAG: efflux RND transporter periplasmic adaptor subunit [Gammaproteobacteria bacterium]|nr:efflux RND transporter periplasmic adaptor subunit [Gammaproteobacteria bacterium]